MKPRYKHYTRSKITYVGMLTGHAAKRTVCGTMRGDGYLTTDLSKVTCPACLKKLNKGE